MKAKQEVTLFEFDCLVAKGALKSSTAPPNIKVISSLAYDYLKQLCLGDESESQLLQLRRRDGMEVLQVQNYAGVIFTPDKTQIEVLPKVGKNFNSKGSTDEHEKARQSLLIMLKALKGFAHIQTSSANITHQKMPLLEVFISQFLNSVNELIKRGLKSDYVRQEDNLGFLKGKLNVGKQVRHNFINKHKFFCEYDEFMLDRPANRLLHSALLKVKGFARSSANQKLLQELLFVFHEIPKSSDHKLDFTKLQQDRGMNYYQTPLEWCRLILNGFSPQTMKGSTNAASLLFPMEKVFEDYVAKVLKEQLATKRPELTLSTQATGQHLATYNNRGKFSLRPDLLIQHGSVNKVVLDTKWKLLDSSMTHSNISQSDVYQMFTYAKKYLRPSETELSVGKDVVLIYPWQDNFDAALEHYYDLDDEHRLWIVPFKICEGQSGLRLPESSREIDDFVL
ncbi:McrC family protein [Vibrio gallaecicus]|uniref:McrC family protein n=1 Tax=Vibrio gallaecicus TaxID=552386 RepID=A0ABV4NDW3_9VIBR